jgi:hypothetical protein
MAIFRLLKNMDYLTRWEKDEHGNNITDSKGNFIRAREQLDSNGKVTHGMWVPAMDRDFENINNEIDAEKEFFRLYPNFGADAKRYKVRMLTSNDTPQDYKSRNKRIEDIIKKNPEQDWLIQETNQDYEIYYDDGSPKGQIAAVIKATSPQKAIAMFFAKNPEQVDILGDKVKARPANGVFAIKDPHNIFQKRL